MPVKVNIKPLVVAGKTNFQVDCLDGEDLGADHDILWQRYVEAG